MPVIVQEDQLMQAIHELAPNTPVVGGTTSEHGPSGTMRQFSNGKVLQGGYSVAAIGGKKAGHVFMNGYLPTGKKAVITAATGRRIVTLDGRPALDVYQEWTGLPRELITGGNIDSMVANYTVSGKKRHDDAYATGGKGGRRPDRAAIVYSNIIREIYPDITIILGGIEASLRRFVHYDFWDDALRKSILADANADILVYGMGERTILELAEATDYSQIKGICYLKNSISEIPTPFVSAPSFEECKNDKKQFARAFKISEREHCHSNGKRVIQQQDERFLVVNPPQAPLSREELDKVFALPYERTYHPSYKDKGGVPALTEVEHSIIHNRGCFGSCNFCSLVAPALLLEPGWAFSGGSDRGGRPARALGRVAA
jgi:radical SAM superfamily enzyme YgiQ (UPF0313 family)